jgi:alpha-D-ribose 1-methylphosphonate 5-triphosphate synthase subunit PhnI
MYVAVKGGEKAIAAAHALMAKKRRGNAAVPELGVDQIAGQLSLAVDRVMAEGSLHAPELAALAIKQARGDMVEAIFLLRAFRTTLARFGSSLPLDTETMRVQRRISATYKDIPGGQVLGSTFDYTHRLLDPALLTYAEKDSKRSGSGKATDATTDAAPEQAAILQTYPKVMSFLEQEGLLPALDSSNDTPPEDITRNPLILPAGRDVRLQNLARGDEGLLLALAYSTQRGFGSTHPFAGEIRMGTVEVSFVPEELGFAVTVGEIFLTECETVNKFHGGGGLKPCFTRGYGLAFGENERKAMSMALVDRSLQSAELGEVVKGPAQEQEFVLYHSDNVEASGFVQHLKLPHYVDFQAELALVRSMQAEAVGTTHEDTEEGYL